MENWQAREERLPRSASKIVATALDEGPKIAQWPKGRARRRLASDCAMDFRAGGGQFQRRHSDDHLRSRSEGNQRAPRPHHTTRHSSKGDSTASLDVRCACQYFKGDTLGPSRPLEKGQGRQGPLVVRFRYVKRPTNKRISIMFSNYRNNGPTLDYY